MLTCLIICCKNAKNGICCSHDLFFSVSNDIRFLFIYPFMWVNEDVIDVIVSADK